MADITFERPEQMSPLARFLAHSWRPLAALIIVALVAAAGYAWYSASAQKAQTKAENDLGAIIATQTGPERLAALEAYVNTAPATTAPDDGRQQPDTTGGKHGRAKSQWDFRAVVEAP